MLNRIKGGLVIFMKFFIKVELSYLPPLSPSECEVFYRPAVLLVHPGKSSADADHVLKRILAWSNSKFHTTDSQN
jgi:hypothetical protein